MRSLPDYRGMPLYLRRQVPRLRYALSTGIFMLLVSFWLGVEVLLGPNNPYSIAQPTTAALVWATLFGVAGVVNLAVWFLKIPTRYGAAIAAGVFMGRAIALLVTLINVFPENASSLGVGVLAYIYLTARGTLVQSEVDPALGEPTRAVVEDI